MVRTRHIAPLDNGRRGRNDDGGRDPCQRLSQIIQAGEERRLLISTTRNPFLCLPLALSSPPPCDLFLVLLLKGVNRGRESEREEMGK